MAEYQEIKESPSYRTLDEIRLRKSQLLVDITKDGNKVEKLWNNLFHKSPRQGEENCGKTHVEHCFDRCQRGRRIDSGMETLPEVQEVRIFREKGKGHLSLLFFMIKVGKPYYPGLFFRFKPLS